MLVLQKKNCFALVAKQLRPAWLEVKGVSGCCGCPIFPVGRGKEPLHI